MIKIYTVSAESLAALEEASSICPTDKVNVALVATGAFFDFRKPGHRILLHEAILNGKVVYFTEELVDILFDSEDFEND